MLNCPSPRGTVTVVHGRSVEIALLNILVKSPCQNTELCGIVLGDISEPVLCHSRKCMSMHPKVCNCGGHLSGEKFLLFPFPASVILNPKYYMGNFYFCLYLDEISKMKSSDVTFFATVCLDEKSVVK